MKLSRRQFMGLAGAMGVSGSAHAGIKDWVKVWERGDGPLTVATVGDLHVKDAASVGIVNRAVKSINQNEEIDLVIVLGDVASDGTTMEMALAKGALDRLEKPYYVIPGNHDVDMTSEDIYRNYRKSFEEGYWHETEDGVTIMGIDSCDGTASDVAIRAEQLEWMEKRLKKISKGKPLLLFVHHPFNPNSKNYRVQNADETLGLFSEHNLKLVASGHYHGNQVEERDGVLFTTTACCSTTRNNFDGTDEKGYRLFMLEKEELNTEFVVVES
jgi:3',5'-cyclic AMP phosphodiesterase CpdA